MSIEKINDKSESTLNPQAELFVSLAGDTPTLTSVAKKSQGQPSEFSAGSIDESMLSLEEKEMVEKVVNEIDLSNINQIVNYGVVVQRNISDFSTAVLKKVKTYDLGEIGTSLKELTTAIDETTEPPRKTMLGENWEQIHDRYLHTLGNLTLTGYNAELGDKPFDVKKDMLEKPDNPTHITVLYQDVLNKDVWNESTINERANRLSRTILKLFSIKPAEVIIGFSDPRYKEYTVNDPGNATYKYVNYYELLGERVAVDSFASMIRSKSI